MRSKNSIIGLGTALLFTLVVAGCATPNDKSTARVTEEKKYIRLNHLSDTAEQADLKKTDAIAMACSKCRTVKPAVVQAPAFRAPTSSRWLGTSFADNNRRVISASGSPQTDWHYCPGCKSTITTTGAGKARTETIKHTCTNYGDSSVLCCATRRDTPPSEGALKN